MSRVTELLSSLEINEANRESIAKSYGFDSEKGAIGMLCGHVEDILKEGEGFSLLNRKNSYFKAEYLVIDKVKVAKIKKLLLDSDDAGLDLSKLRIGSIDFGEGGIFVLITVQK